MPNENEKSKKPQEIKESNVLMVEGRDDEVFFNALKNHLGLQNIQIIILEGKQNLRYRLDALASTSRFKEMVTSLGIVRDANNNANRAFQSVRDALQFVNLPAPTQPLTPFGEGPKVTVMILPGEGESGMLEDLCLNSVVSDPAMICVEQYLECLQQQNFSLSGHTSKRKVQVFLASRERPGKLLGQAARAGYWPWDDSTFEQVESFLRQVGS